MFSQKSLASFLIRMLTTYLFALGDGQEDGWLWDRFWPSPLVREAPPRGPHYRWWCRLRAFLPRAEPLLYETLVERWWDTTNSFHFSSIGKLALTPYDFLMFTGLRVGVGDPIPFDLDMAQWRTAQRHLLNSHHSIMFRKCFISNIVLLSYYSQIVAHIAW